MEHSELGKGGVGGSEEDEIFSRKSKFLDVQSLYKSRALKEGIYDRKGGGKTAKENENGEIGKGRKRSKSSSSGSRGEGAEGKKSRKNSDDQRVVNGVVRNGAVSLNEKGVTSLGQLRNSVSAFVGVSLSLDHNGTFFRIPKRPRGTARRKRVDRDSSLKEPVRQFASVYKVAGVNDEVKKIEVDRVSIIPDSSVASGSDEPAGKLQSTSVSNVEKQNAKRKTSRTEHKENENGTISAQHFKEEHGPYVAHDGDTYSMKRRPKRRKWKGLSSGIRTTAEKVGNPVGESGSVCTHSLDDDDDEENLEQNAARMLSSRFDPSCTGLTAKMRSSVSPDTNEFSYIIPSAQDLVHRDISSMAGSESPTVDNPSRVLRPRTKHCKKGLSRKRRHYYEIVPRGMDAHWVLNRKIKIFWPLDKSWYYGLVSDYDPEKRVHHIKYDDRDEEWVDLQGEKFKLLLLPGEVPAKAKHKQSGRVLIADKGNMSAKFDDNDRQTENNLDSEPIIAWLSRSSRQVKQSPSSPLKRQKLLGPLSLKSDDSCTNIKGNGHLLVRHGSDESDGLTLCRGDDDLRAGNFECSEDRDLVVYYRKRYRKNCGNLSSVLENISEISSRTPNFPAKESSSLQTWTDQRSRVLGWSGCDQNLWLLDDNGSLQLSMRLLESAVYRFATCLSLLALHWKLFGREQIWLSDTLFLRQYGTLVSRWPIVELEMIFLDNIIGMRSLLLEGSMDHVSAFVFLILSVFNRHGEDCLLVEAELPVTSIRIRLSCVVDPRKKLLFAFYKFSKLKSSKWLHLESELKCRLLRTQELPLSECTYDNINAFEGLNYQCEASCAGLAKMDLQKITKQYMVPICRSGESCSSKMGRTAFSLVVTPGKLPPFVVSFPAAPTFFLNLHLRMLMRRNFACVTLENDDSSEATEGDTLINKQDSCPALSLLRKDMEINSMSNLGTCSRIAASAGCLTSGLPHSEKDAMHATDVGASTLSTWCLPNSKVDVVTATSSVGGMSVEIPSFDQVGRSPDERTCLLRQPPDWNSDMDYIKSPNCPGPSNSFQQDQCSISLLHDLSPAWSDGKANMVYDAFSNGPKKPRTQVHYTISNGGNDLSSKQKLHQKSLPYRRIRRADERRNSNGSRSPQRNLEFSACDANVLVTSGDKGWRDYGARVVLELADHNEWRLATSMSGVTKYSCKVNNILQWSTNRHTHAMMWKGGKDWTLEFPDRTQWLLFKEIYGECYNRNIRASSVKHIPIPGVRLIEEIDDCANNSIPFVRHPAKYFKQVENDVEMVMNPAHVLYDMDNEDELWLSENERAVCSKSGNCDEISDELFEKTMDMFEKVSHAEKRDHFTVDEIDELDVGVGSTGVAKYIYEHWLQKRQRKGIALIRHLQPPLWEQYQQQVKEWEQAIARGSSAVSSVSQERHVPKERPPMFAFCLRPRGLEILNKGSKHRSHRRLSVSLHNHADLEAGRRLNGVAFGGERILFSGNCLDASEGSPLLHASTWGYSPRDASGFGCFSLGNDGSEWNHPPSHRNKTRKCVGGFPDTPSVASHNKRTIGKRNGIHQWTVDVAEWPSQRYYQPEVALRHNSLQFDGSDVQEFKLRDASRAARHAQDMAKIKRERALKLMYRADMAIHKAVVALMTAEAMEVANDTPNCDG